MKKVYTDGSCLDNPGVGGIVVEVLGNTTTNNSSY
jgi:ribonuclease HI